MLSFPRPLPRPARRLPPLPRALPLIRPTSLRASCLIPQLQERSGRSIHQPSSLNPPCFFPLESVYAFNFKVRPLKPGYGLTLVRLCLHDPGELTSRGSEHTDHPRGRRLEKTDDLS